MIVRPVSRLVQELDAKSFTVIGCACHGGLGAEAMHFLRSGLSGAEGDFIAVVGDIVPLGRDPFYHTMAQFIDAYAPKPVHVLKCNHDGPDFDECFGHPNRAVIAEECVLIMLDNSERRFSDETLAFLCETMAVVDSHNVIVAFHIPPPNRISGNTMDVEEWQRFEEAVGVWRSRISLLLCGHEHCYYEDDIDGLRLVASGGTAGPGDWVERVAPGGQHALEISFGGDGRPIVRTRALDAAMDAEHCGEVRSMLVRAFDLQCRDHVSMRLWSEEARGRGEEGMARLYRAASESALIQVRILHRLLTGGRSGPEEQPA
ncbi:MAG: metallophosphoesterase, partial [Planctomycetota bacterium]|nr:metallophosphoesterase [Planctomycetota bacterium]